MNVKHAVQSPASARLTGAITLVALSIHVRGGGPTPRDGSFCYQLSPARAPGCDLTQFRVWYLHACFRKDASVEVTASVHLEPHCQVLDTYLAL